MNPTPNLENIEEQQSDEALNKARGLIVDHIKTNPFDEGSVKDFVRKITDMRDRGEITEAMYLRQIVELYSELFLNEQERLMAEGKTEEQALAENHWASETEEKMNDAMIEAKSRDGEEGMPEVATLAQIRATTIWPQGNNN